MLSALNLPLAERRKAAAVLRTERDTISGQVNRDLVARYPAWCGSNGEDASAAAALNAARHVEVLAGALESGESGGFVEYVGWMKSMLQARNVDSHLVAESLRLIRPAALANAGAAARAAVDDLLCAGLNAARPDNDNDSLPCRAPDTSFLQAILSGDRKGALEEARSAFRAASRPTDVYVDLFQKTLAEVGSRWERNEISVAQEHLATTTVQFVLAQLYESIDRSSPSRGSALVTGVEGELHQVGANLVADVLEADGWQVRFLGTNMPHDGIVEAAREMGAELIAVSTTMLFNVDAAARLVEDLRKSKPDRAPRILVGGSAFRAAPKLWREVGADGFAVDLRQVCAAARGEHRCDD